MKIRQQHCLNYEFTHFFCQVDERLPPLVDDFLYVCDDAYTREKLLRMERKVLAVVGFDLGYPLSYRFLRRYGRVCKENNSLTLFKAIYDAINCDILTGQKMLSYLFEMSQLCRMFLYVIKKLYFQLSQRKSIHFYVYIQKAVFVCSLRFRELLNRISSRFQESFTQAFGWFQAIFSFSLPLQIQRLQMLEAPLLVSEIMFKRQLYLIFELGGQT